MHSRPRAGCGGRGRRLMQRGALKVWNRHDAPWACAPDRSADWMKVTTIGRSAWPACCVLMQLMATCRLAETWRL